MRLGERIGLDRIFNSPRPTSFLRVNKQQLEVAKRGGQIWKIKTGTAKKMDVDTQGHTSGEERM